jgi:hypothetical protein
VEDGWRESSRPELSAVCRGQRPTDDRATRAGHPHSFLICPTVHLPVSAVISEEGNQAGEEIGPLAGIGLAW